MAKAHDTMRGSAGSGLNLVSHRAEIDFQGIIRVVWRRKFVIFATFILIMFLAQLSILQLTPRYTATTRVMLNTPQSPLLDLSAIVSGLPTDVETEIQVIRSRGLALKTIEQLKLDQVPEFNPLLRTSKGPVQFLGLDSLLPEKWLLVLDGTADAVKFGENGESQIPAVIDAFLSRLNVRTIGRSRVMQIDFQAEDPKTAALVVNTLADFYIVAQLEAKFEATQRANNWLNDRLSELRQKLEASENAVETFKAELGVLEGKDITLAQQQVSELSTQLVLASARRAESDSRVRQVEAALSSGIGFESINEVMQSSLVTRLREQEANVEREAAGLAQ